MNSEHNRGADFASNWPTVRLQGKTTTIGILSELFLIPYSLVHPHIEEENFASSQQAGCFFCKQSLGIADSQQIGSEGIKK